MDTGSVIWELHTPPTPKEKPALPCYGIIAFSYCGNRPRWGGQRGLLMTIADDGLRPDRVEAVELVLDIGAEGGALTIVGMRVADGWRFRLVRDESTLR
jgi:hypothetical protein